MRQYKTYIFDWDGCISDTLSVWMNTYLRVYKENGLTNIKEKDVIENSWANREQGPLNLGFKNYEKIWEQIVQQVKEISHKAQLNHAALQLIEELHLKGKNIAIHTSSYREIIEKALKYHNLEQYIGMTVSADDQYEPKPSSEGVEAILRFFKAEKKSAIFIGDTAKDIQTAKNSGIDSILYLPDKHKQFYDFDELSSSDPTYTATTFEEVIMQHTELTRGEWLDKFVNTKRKVDTDVPKHPPKI